MNRRVLFLRDFQGFTGGHLKVWHYFSHLAASGRYRPEIYFTAGSRLDYGNPWISHQVPLLETWKAMPGDVVFLAGMDWAMLPDPQSLADSRAPIVNLIQHVRHADATDPRFAFLGCPATRICVSEEISAALRRTGRVAGHIHTVPAATDVKVNGKPRAGTRRIPLLIAGNKNPDFAGKLSRVLRGRRIEHRLITNPLPRNEYLDALRASSAAVLLPERSEGFYLPALEAMALRTLVICPDCIGNRGHCLDGVNCLRPEYTLDAVIESVARLHSLPEPMRAAMLDAGARTVERHDLPAERERVCRIFDHLDDASGGAS